MKDLSVIIPTARKDIITIHSLPEWVNDVQIRRDDGLNNARNAGVASASNPWIVIIDDDLEFDEHWFEGVVERLDENTVMAAKGTGLLDALSWPEGFESGMGRLMAFHRQVWEDTGGFPSQRSHGGDSDFLMSAYEAGYRVEGLDHEWVHHDDSDSYSFFEHLEWLWFLTREHPGLVAPRLPELFRRKFA